MMRWTVLPILIVAGLTGYIVFKQRKNWYPAPPKVNSAKKHIACIGDSITFGNGEVDSPNSDTWGRYLSEVLPENYQVLNYGLIGRTLQDEGDYPYRKSSFWRILQETAAEFYLIMLGTNDSKRYNWNAERYRVQLSLFVDLLCNLPNHPKVILIVPPACFSGKKGKVRYDIQAEVIRDEIRPILLSFADERGIPCIDLYTFTKNHPEWFDDGVHPNAQGNRAIGEFIAQTLMKFLI